MARRKSIEEPRRSLLYYPTIVVPSGSWLRRAVLYWDEVASIVPQQVDGTPATPFTPEIAYLYGEQEFRPVRPESLYEGHWQEGQEFEDEFQSRVKPKKLKKEVGKRNSWKLDARVHHDKVSEQTFFYLLEKGLVQPKPVYEDGMRWYLFERTTALLYMSLLAKYLANLDSHLVTPSTDVKAYQDTVYLAKHNDESVLGLEFLFKNIIPVPRSDVSLRQIVEFKRRRKLDLLRFRELVDKFQKDVASAEDKATIRDITVRFNEQVQRGVGELTEIMNDSRLPTILGSLRSIVSVTSPTFWSTLGVLAGKATKVADLPADWTALGLAGMGAFEIVWQYLDKRNERNAKLRGSAYSYLYHARTLS